VDYEAQAAIELEGLARGVSTVDAPYEFTLSHGGDAPIVADPGPAVRAAAADAAAGVPAAVIGARFHRAVIALVVALAVDARERGAGHTAVLTGGVFQNTLLLSGARKALAGNGFRVLCHRQVPPNDGGARPRAGARRGQRAGIETTNGRGRENRDVPRRTGPDHPAGQPRRHDDGRGRLRRRPQGRVHGIHSRR
jgi:hypothetical protein